MGIQDDSDRGKYNISGSVSADWSKEHPSESFILREYNTALRGMVEELIAALEQLEDDYQIAHRALHWKPGGAPLQGQDSDLEFKQRSPVIQTDAALAHAKALMAGEPGGTNEG